MDKNDSEPGDVNQVDLDKIRPSVNGEHIDADAMAEEAQNLETEPQTARELLAGKIGDPEIEVE